jgi:lactosylceramide 4-alpha-galactosyltransferase
MNFQLRKLLIFIPFTLFIAYFCKAELFDLSTQTFNLRKESTIESLREEGIEKETGDLLSAKVQPVNGENIFFVDTNESTENVTISFRQACAIESAALANVEPKIFLIFTSEKRFKNLEITENLKYLLSLPNLNINFVDLKSFSVGTPMENFIVSGALEKSKFRQSHTSDIMRMLLLWKFGGTYLDTDMIVRKKIDSVQSNFACAESEEYMNGAIINFDLKIGKKLIEIFIEDLIANFSGTEYSQNGPFLVTRVLKKLCNTKIISGMKECQGFHVLPKEKCYPIEWRHWEKLMNENDADSVMEKVNDSIVVHFWNKFSKNIKLRNNSKAPYIQLAKEFCPKTLNAVKEYF